jgi:2'-5' RNA ligase
MVGDGKARLFVAVPMTEEARRAVDAHLRTHLSDRVPGRPVRVDNWHLTLRFLGPSTAEQRRGMADALAAADLGGAFAIRFGGLGAFPRPRSARVVWMGITGGVERLQALAAVAEQAARANGFAAEEKPYRPHLTLSRIQPNRDVGRVVESVPAPELEMPVREIVVYRSHLGGGPARYEAVERFPLS